MRFLTNLALVLSLLAVPAAASACGMEMRIDRKHTLVAAKAADVPSSEKASALKALLAEVDAKMEAELVTAPTASTVAAAPEAPAVAAVAAVASPDTAAVEAKDEPATYPSGFPMAKVARR